MRKSKNANGIFELCFLDRGLSICNGQKPSWNSENLNCMTTFNVARKLVSQSVIVAIAFAAWIGEAQAQNVSQPNVQTPTVSTPIVQTPVVETPVVETPTVQTPVVDVPQVEVSQDVPIAPSSGGGGATAVPEPSTAAGLLVIGALGAGAIWQRKKVLVK